MKVCFIVGTLARGGAERQLVFMLRALQNKGIKARLLCLTKGEAFEEEVKDLGIEIEWVGAMQNRFLRLCKIVSSTRKRPADILHSSHFYTNIYTAAAGRILDIPNIGAIRNDLFSEIAANRAFGRAQLTWPSHLIVNSKLAESRAIEEGISPNRLTFIRNVVESPASGRDHSNGKGVNVLFVGRLVRQKRPDIFVDLADRLRTSLPDVSLSFQMVGDGEMRPEVEKLAVKYGFDKHDFHLAGERAQMSEVYKWADILVSTSAHEGTPNAILEAMSYGIPVVATRVGGIPEIVSEKCGILADPSDRDGLLRSVSELVLKPRMRACLGMEGSKYVKTSHSLDYLQQKLTGLYSRLTER